VEREMRNAWQTFEKVRTSIAIHRLHEMPAIETL
jgi:hypothetical protein